MPYILSFEMLGDFFFLGGGVFLKEFHVSKCAPALAKGSSVSR